MTTVQMNNLNNPDDCNIRPDMQGDGDGSRWNYALLVPMLGLAFFKHIWQTESQKEIEQIKVKNNEKIMAIQMDLEQKTRETDQLKLNLKKKDIDLKVKDQELRESVALKELECRLIERQWAHCSMLVSRTRRYDIEDDLLNRLAKNPVFADLKLENDLRDVFMKDQKCAGMLNKNDRKNGYQMWTFLEKLQNKLTANRKL